LVDDMAAGLGHRVRGEPSRGRPDDRWPGVAVGDGADGRRRPDALGAARMGRPRPARDPGCGGGRWRGYRRAMSIVKINAISVPEQAREEMDRRFAARQGAVDKAPGFERFQLLRPTEGGDRYFVV